MNNIIENTLKFLQRTDLKWNEVWAFVECVNYLNDLKETPKENKTKK